MTTDVLVAGAGPVGLLLASELRLGGVDVTVYDKLTAPAAESRALGFNRRAAETLDQRGLLGRLGEFRWGPMGHFGGVRFDLSMLDDDHSGVLGLSQVVTERMLAARLAELGVPVRRGRTLTGLEQAPDGVTIAFDGPDGPGTDRARYLVGCDGAGSTVRALAGIAAPGFAATRGMYTAEITGATPRPRPIGERLPGGAMVVCTPLGDGRCRVVVHDKRLPAHPEPGTLTFAEVADAWQRLTGESIAAATPLWVWACGNAARQADTYRRGRVLLAGDAAHEIPPLAAWGLSAGLQDAANLGWKLAATIRGDAPETLLDSYDAERRPVGRQLLRDARAASLLYLGDTDMDPVRDVLSDLLTQPGAAGQLAGIVSGLGIRYDMSPAGSPGAGHPLLGLRMPPGRELITPDGGRIRVADLLPAGRGVLIVTPGPSGDTGTARAVEQLAAGWGDRIDVVAGRWADAPPGRADQAAAQDPSAVLIRPDGYVAWAAPDDEAGLAAALDRWFGVPVAARTGARA